MSQTLERITHIRSLQCGEPGPFRQVIAGLDIAAWDLVSNRVGMPLCKVLSDAPARRVAAYASGIHISKAAREIEHSREIGFLSFKVKVGFNGIAECGALVSCLQALRPAETLCADANQAWSLPEAQEYLSGTDLQGLKWIEEPIAADAPLADWKSLAQNGIALAAGENISGVTDFKRHIAVGALRYIQPDVCKWGGVSGNLRVAQHALSQGRVYCPHFLGGGVGLLASAHVLAAAGGEGALEVDVNPNPLRELIAEAQTYWTCHVFVPLQVLV